VRPHHDFNKLAKGDKERGYGAVRRIFAVCAEPDLCAAV